MTDVLDVQKLLVLFRAFFAQFFVSESATSDHQHRVAIIGVIVFLVTPGFLMPIQMAGPFEFAALRFPEMLPSLIQVSATLFITYGIVSMGVIAAFAWDALGFDRRDAMVLGPLPIRGATVIAAKLSALAALMLGGAFAVNLLTAVPFSMIASNHTGVVAMVRHFFAHMIATMCAALFVFSVLVTVRAMLSMIGSGRATLTSFVQFVLVSAVLCFVVLAPRTIDVVRPARRRGVATLALQHIPSWSPTNWFLGLYETVRGVSGPSADEFARLAVLAIEITVAAIAIGILATVVGYRRQMQLALAPSASVGATGAARIRRWLARLLAGRNRVARATADFIVSTLVRNRAQQVPVALNAAVGLAMVVAGLSTVSGDLTALMRVRTIVLWIPLILAYWVTIGVRASFFVPSELPAAWVFCANAPARGRAYWLAVRSALIATLVPPTLFVAALLVPLVGWRVAGWHALVSATIAVLMSELVAQTIDFIPFTRAYRPGHSKLKSRWPLYLLGIFAFAVWPARAELTRLHDPNALLEMIGWIAAAAVVLEIAGWLSARRWSVEPKEDPLEEIWGTTVLAIGNPLHSPIGH